MHGFKDRLNDLKWLGDPELVDVGWFETDIPEPEDIIAPEPTKEEIAINTSKALLSDSDWTMMPDVPMTAGEKSEWIEYRRKLREIKYQAGFPDNITWPSKPE